MEITQTLERVEEASRHATGVAKRHLKVEKSLRSEFIMRKTTKNFLSQMHKA